MAGRASGSAALPLVISLAFAPGAGADDPVLIGSSWPGPPDKLQSIVDATYGPGRIQVATDYLGAHAGDPDPIVWSSPVRPILQVREIAGDGHRADLGWYIEPGDGSPPVIDGVGDGPVFTNADVVPSTMVVLLRIPGLQVGFFLRSADAGSGQGPRTFFTNRRFNDPGPGGVGALHEPAEGGDVQALVYDVSPWTRPRTWLVCFEDSDSGAQPGPCCETTDNDYADYVFEVRAEVVTPTLPNSFGSLKSLYR